MRSFISRPMLVNIATIGVGIIAGFMTLPLVANILPKSMLTERQNMTGFGKQLGLVNVLIGALLFGFMRNRRIKEVGLIIAGTGVYDLIAVNVPQLNLPPLPMSNPLIPAPKMSASYPALVNPASRVADSYGPSSYDGRSLGASYESNMMRAFSGDDMFSE